MRTLTYPSYLKNAGLGNHPQNYSMSFRSEDHVSGIPTHNIRGVLYISQKGQLRNPLRGSHTNPNFLEDIPLDGPYHAADRNQHPKVWKNSLSKNDD